jgi:hypothetical protein
MPKKKKKKEDLTPSFDILRVYGVWSISQKKLLFISLTSDEANLKFDIEEYDEKDCCVVRFDIAIDINSLGQ